MRCCERGDTGPIQLLADLLTNLLVEAALTLFPCLFPPRTALGWSFSVERCFLLMPGIPINSL